VTVKTAVSAVAVHGFFTSERWLKTALFDSVYAHQDTDWHCDAPSVFQ